MQRMVVVLPEPLGPRKPVRSSAAGRERGAVKGRDRAVALGKGIDLKHAGACSHDELGCRMPAGAEGGSAPADRPSFCELTKRARTAHAAGAGYPCVVDRQLISSGSPYERTVGFSRAVRIGGRVLVSGTAPIWSDGSCDPDPGVQAGRCLEIILAALAEAGAGPEHVVRTRSYLVDRATKRPSRVPTGAFRRDPAGEHDGRGGRPADPRWKVEMEAEAILDPVDR